MQTRPRKGSYLSAIISIGVIACLCFSIGEGLRLTPFPVSAVSESEAFGDTNNSLRRYGPLDVPTRTQSRNKRQVVDYAYSAPVRDLQPPPIKGSAYRESFDFRSLPTGTPQTGRAPPLT